MSKIIKLIGLYILLIMIIQIINSLYYILLFKSKYNWTKAIVKYNFESLFKQMHCIYQLWDKENINECVFNFQIKQKLLVHIIDFFVIYVIILRGIK
jgi:hypothetical protein